MPLDRSAQVRTKTADDTTVNPFFLALNILVVAGIALALLWPQIRERRQADVDLPNAIRPNRPGQELTDAVTEWAKATGVLTQDGTPGEHAMTDDSEPDHPA